MPQFFYFVPTEKPTLAAKDLREIGLSYLGLRGGVTAGGCTGPDGVRGLIFAGDGKEQVKYKPAEQTWQTGPDGKFWIGYAKTQPLPGPDDLVKPRFITGERVELGEPVDTEDGEKAQMWTIPICVSLTRGITLPQKLAVGPGGKGWTQQQLPEFAGLCEMAAKCFDEFMAGQQSGDGFKVSIDDGGDRAALALAVNYRLGPIEIDILGLLSTESMFRVIDAFLDFPEYRRAQATKPTDPDAGEKKDDTGAT